jgi:hypothetical protein
LKVVIKRVGDGGNSSNDESQQQVTKHRKKQSSQQPHMNNVSGQLPTVGRKLPMNPMSGGSSPSVIIKSDNFDVSAFNSDSNMNSMTMMNDGGQQTPRLAHTH